MITPAPARSTGVNANYNILGHYVQDDSRIPYYNATAAAYMIEPGEPVTMTWGAGAVVLLAQTAIFPGEVGMLARYFVADFPCLFSTNVLHGAEVYWDFTNKRVALAADVTNGFALGGAIWAIDPNIKNKAPALSGTKVIAASAASTRVRVVGMLSPTTIKGTIITL
jgi:predicted RecA/RadA family phage recombinase